MWLSWQLTGASGKTSNIKTYSGQAGNLILFNKRDENFSSAHGLEPEAA